MIKKKTNLSSLFTSTRITAFQHHFSKLQDSAHVVAVARVVGAADGARGLANASVATVGNRRANSHFHAIVRATAGHGDRGADHLAIVLTGTVIAAISFRDCSPKLDGGAIVRAPTRIVGALHLRLCKIR